MKGAEKEAESRVIEDIGEINKNLCEENALMRGQEMSTSMQSSTVCAYVSPSVH